MSDTILYLNEAQVVEMIKTAEKEDGVIVVRCRRKTAASATSEGADKGDLYDLHCGQKPKDYVAKTARDRQAEDAGNGVLTVYATNRKNGSGTFGEFRRVNVRQVVKLIYKSQEWTVTHTDASGRVI